MTRQTLERALLSAVTAACLLVAGTADADAQILRKLKEKAKQQVEKQVEGNAEPKADEAIAESKEALAQPGTGAWLNYDFVPGERVLYLEDFATDAVGDFPKRLTLKRGNMEVAELNGARYLRASSPGEVVIQLPEALPQRFTLELDYMAPGGSEHQFIYFGEQPNAPYVLFRLGEGGIEGPGGMNIVSRAPDAKAGRFYPVRVMADGKHAKVYIGGTRVANVPQVELGRSASIRLRISGQTDRPAYFGNLRIAAGGRKLYDAIAADGRVATQGILFDTNSDRIRPESTPTLREIGQMLKEHADLDLTIEGHTDAVGDDAANRKLSEKRAAAIRQYLVKEYGIAGDRLATAGLGESKPVASNETAEGRQQNRRVELVRR